MWGQIAAIAAPTILGALAGQGSGSQSQTMYRNVGAAGADESKANASVMEQLAALQGFVGAGPGQADISSAYGAQNDLAAMLKQFSQGGYVPTAGDQDLARQQLAPQFEQARQSQVQAGQQYSQRAAQMGRGGLDFATTNKMNQNFSNQMQLLAAQQSQLASAQPMQRLGFAQDYANLKQGLASQAMQNRIAIANLGSSIRDSERNLRLGSASTTTVGQQGNEQSNMLMGGLAGLGTGLSMYNMFSGKPAAATASPWDNVQASSSLGNLVNMQGNAGSSYGAASRMPAASSILPAQRSSNFGVPSFLNPATAYTQPQQTNFFQGIPGFK